MMALGTLLRKPPLPPGSCRAFWGWLNAVFNKVDHERIRAVGPDRAASEWLLRCGALVRYQGSPKWQQDYNALPTGPLGRYRIEAINATDSCIMYRGFDYLVPKVLLELCYEVERHWEFQLLPKVAIALRKCHNFDEFIAKSTISIIFLLHQDGLEHVTDIRLEKCMYIQDQCLQRLSETNNLQKSLQQLRIISCGNVTDKGILALHKLANLEYLYLSDLPGIREKETTFRVLQQALPKLELELDLE